MRAVSSRLSSLSRDRPLAFAACVVAIYAGWFVVRGLAAPDSLGRGGSHGNMEALVSQLPAETLLAASALVLILGAGLQRETRLATRPRRLWLTLPPLIVIAVIALAALAIASNLPAGTRHAAGTLAALLASVALIGVFEELLFRGILFQGIERRGGPVPAVLVSSACFGLMHYVNWIAGQPLAQTTDQVVFAAASGLFYAALLLHTGSIWPGVVIHALWDGSAGLLAPLQQALPDRVDPGGGEGTEVAGALFSALVAGALPVYGAVLLLVWIVRRRLCDGARCRELARAPEPLS